MEEVGFSYGDKSVLKDISWLIGPGERYGILGENGVGKSTLLSVMTGRLRPTSGYVKIGKSVRFGILTQNLDELHTKDDWRVSEVLSTYKKYYAVDAKSRLRSSSLSGSALSAKSSPPTSGISLADSSAGWRCSVY